MSKKSIIESHITHNAGMTYNEKMECLKSKWKRKVITNTKMGEFNLIL